MKRTFTAALLAVLMGGFFVCGAIMPARAQSNSVVILPGGCGTGNFPNNSGYLTIDSTGHLCDSGGGGGGSTPGAGSQPYNYTPLTPGQYGLTIASATALTIPSGALQAVVCASGNNVNYTYDGTTTPTASVGLPLLTNQCVQFSGATVLANLKFIQQSATATLNVGYTK